MDKASIENKTCDKYRPLKEYTKIQVFIDNLPYLFMILIGSIIFLIGFKFTLLGISLAGIYIIYGILGALLLILFVCPYCQYYDTKSCPCGYGLISAKFRNKSNENRFNEKFKKHIPFIVPLWIIPLVAGIIFLFKNFDRFMLIVSIAFMIDSFIILPLLARKYGRNHCPQKDDCPWMLKEKKLSVS